jgi:hypothetical protein
VPHVVDDESHEVFVALLEDGSDDDGAAEAVLVDVLEVFVVGSWDITVADGCDDCIVSLVELDTLLVCEDVELVSLSLSLSVSVALTVVFVEAEADGVVTVFVWVTCTCCLACAVCWASLPMWAHASVKLKLLPFHSPHQIIWVPFGTSDSLW